jgi:hypothetical protein
MDKRRRFGPAWLVLGLSALAGGCGSKDTEHLTRIGQKLAARFDQLSGGAPGKAYNSLEAARAGWNGAPLDARVSCRLRLDKQLADIPIQVRASGGVVELRGSVADAEQRQRAVELAETTVGVEQVIDSLTVPEPPP